MIVLTISKLFDWLVLCARVPADVSGPLIIVIVSLLQCCMWYCIWVSDPHLHFTSLLVGNGC